MATRRRPLLRDSALCYSSSIVFIAYKPMPDQKPATPVSTSLVPPPAPPAAPAPQGGRTCLGTLAIVVVTVFCTLLVEAVIGFFLVGYIVKKVSSTIANNDLVKSFTSQTSGGVGSGSQSGTAATTKEQSDLLKSLGINPKDLPAEIPVEKVVCAEKVLGADRIKEIVSGKATPGLTDIFKLRSCL